MNNEMKTKSYQICTKCVMDTTDPDITFDEKGICNHCHTRDQQIAMNIISGEEGVKKAESIVKKIKNDGINREYDCVIGVSGGVDSTFVAYKVVQFGLRPLAVHLDNGWDSELAVKNIENICRKLNIDLHTIVLNWNEFKDLQLSFLKAATPDSEIPSDHAIVTSLLHTARKKRIRHIITGYNLKTETHIPPSWSQGYFDWGYIKNIHGQFGSVPLKSFPHLGFIDFVSHSYRKKFVNILNYLDYSKKESMPILERELDWQYYGGKHYESIYTRWYQGYWLPTKFGYDKRRSHFSSLICSGEMTRDVALEELNQPTYPSDLQREDTAYVLKKLDITREEMDELLGLPIKSYWDYSPYARYFSTTAYRSLRTIYRAVARNK